MLEDIVGLNIKHLTLRNRLKYCHMNLNEIDYYQRGQMDLIRY